MDNSQLPAYPIVLLHPEVDHTRGLTKLEAMTMAAMQGLCANAFISDKVGPEIIAQDAVTIARATLSELSKQQHG